MKLFFVSVISILALSLGACQRSEQAAEKSEGVKASEQIREQQARYLPPPLAPIPGSSTAGVHLSLSQSLAQAEQNAAVIQAAVKVEVAKATKALKATAPVAKPEDDEAAKANFAKLEAELKQELIREKAATANIQQSDSIPVMKGVAVSREGNPPLADQVGTYATKPGARLVDLGYKKVVCSWQTGQLVPSDEDVRRLHAAKHGIPPSRQQFRGPTRSHGSEGPWHPAPRNLARR